MIEIPNSSVLEELLTSEDVYIEPVLATRAAVLEFCAKKIHEKIKKSLSYRVFWEKIEQADQTNIILPSGLYIPHLKIQELEKMMAVLVMTPGGAKDSFSEAVFYATVFFVTPLKPAFFQKHLNLLSLLSASFSSENIKKMISMKSSKEVYSALRNLKK
ncbi:MAG: hypothetical protein Fur0012_07890 [Elusimicrobiota bacterium]